jgi:2-keto-4-pentenoate hydratase/2-oxohepta-3-ene-1,7-dioic acid hydratase in catechol pathway
MRLVTFEDAEGRRRIGARVDANRIVDLHAAYELYLHESSARAKGRFKELPGGALPGDMRQLFEAGDQGLDAARKALEFALKKKTLRKPLFYRRQDVKLKAPILPKKFFHTAGNFREHHEEAQKAGFSHPVMPWIVFFQNVDAIIGPEEPVIYPSHLTEELDYELELAVVLKKSGKHFSAEEAGDYIGGYVIFNDVTARDIQRREMKSGVFSFCKGIDTFCPLGPHIVTADEIPDPHNLAMELRVNGEPRQRSHTSKMAVKIPEILAHYSAMGYSAGDVVSTGTVSGVAAFSGDPKKWYLKPGDVMECEIEKIGVLRNPVISWEQGHPAKKAGKKK